MKRQKDVRTYLFPWVLLTATTFFFYAIEEYSGYLYVFEQFLTICKYFSYVYALILLTEFFRYRMEHPGKKSAKKHTKRAAFRRRKKDLAEPPAAAPAETAETTAPEEEQKEEGQAPSVKGKWLTRERRLTLLTAVHIGLLLFLLIRFGRVQFPAFYVGTISGSGTGIIFIGICLLAAVVYFLIGGWLKGLPKKPGSATAQGLVFCCGVIFALSALFFTLDYMLQLNCLRLLVWIIRGLSLAVIALFAAGLAVGLIKKNLLTDFDYLFLLNLYKDGKTKNVADFLEEHTGLSVKSLWSIRYAVSLLPAAVLSLGAVVLLATCFYKVDPQQQAVVYRFGQISDASPVGSGLHVKLPWPIDKAEIYDTQRVKEVLVGYEKQQSVDNLWNQAHGGEEYKLLLGNGNELVSVNIKIAYVIDDLRRYVTAFSSPEDILTAKAYEIILSKTVSTDLDTFLSVDRSGLSAEIAKDLNEFCSASEIGLRVNGVTLESIHPPIDIASVYQGVVSAGVQKTTLITNAQATEAEKVAAAEQEANTLILAAKQDQTKRVSDAEYEISGFLAAAEAYRKHPGAVTLAKYLDTFETVVSGNKVYVFIGDHDLTDYMINFSGNTTVVNNSDLILSSKPAKSEAK